VWLNEVKVVVKEPKAAAVNVYTLVNLHADKGGKIESIGYQKFGIIPICTSVTITDMDSDEIEFTNKETGIEYTFELHKSNQVPISKHRERIFGESCADINAMSKVDRRGIEDGQAVIGMTKEAVIQALGFPPEHATPSTKGNVWKYWTNRFNTFDVHFSDGLVKSITE